jgi:hypothetical protein
VKFIGPLYRNEVILDIRDITSQVLNVLLQVLCMFGNTIGRIFLTGMFEKYSKSNFGLSEMMFVWSVLLDKINVLLNMVSV